MRQKVVIRALVERQGKILLLRRVGGRPSISGLYELPGGSLHVGEQPVDALKRSLQIHAGIEPETFCLRDVVSFIDPDYRIPSMFSLSIAQLLIEVIKSQRTTNMIKSAGLSCQIYIIAS